MDPETALIKAFILRNRQDRYTEMLGNPKRRRKILGKLHHMKDLDSRFLVEIAPSDSYADSIAAILKKRGAPAQCHVIGGGGKLDGRDLPLVEALDQTVGLFLGALISCIPGRLGFYEGEELKDRFILERKPA